MQETVKKARKAALNEDWEMAVKSLDAAAAEINAALRDMVNLARTVGGQSDKDIARFRGTSPSAVTQKFGARSGLLRDAMAKAWEDARTEWATEEDDA